MILPGSLPLLLLNTLTSILSPVLNPNPTEVTTSYGVVEGHASTNGQRFTVPYALPPTGSRRFADPASPAKFSDVYNATDLPLPCAQNLGGITSDNEDCLYLTIYTPKGVTAISELPVFVWVHGGSFYAGGATNPGLDGSTLAANQNMIVVVVQYRLSAFGWLSSSSLGITGNYGQKDLVAALQYISSEISHFGGNPSSVTVAGQSSGASMVASLFTIPTATSLFDQAILHSAPLAYAELTTDQADSYSQTALSTIGCSTLDCLQSASVDQILNGAYAVAIAGQASTATVGSGANANEPLRMVIDGSFITQGFQNTVLAGGALQGKGKPMIITTVEDEACYAIAQSFPQPYPTAYFEPIVDLIGGPARAATILASGLYDPTLLGNDTDAVRDSVTSLTSDSTWTCASQQTAVNITASSSSNVYLAQFNLGVSYYNNTFSYCVGKVGHEDDIYPLFGTAPLTTTKAQQALSKELGNRWGAFVRTGSPNSVATSPTWSPVASASRLNMLEFGATRTGGSVVVQSQRAAECAVGSGIWGRTVAFQ